MFGGKVTPAVSKNRELYQKLPQEECQNARNNYNYYSVPKKVLEVLKDVPRVNILSYIFMNNGSEYYSFPVMHVYETAKMFLNLDSEQRFDGSAFILGIIQCGEERYGVYHVPYSMNLKTFLALIGLFDRSLFYYVGEYLLNEFDIIRTIRELNSSGYLPNYALIKIEKNRRPLKNRPTRPDQCDEAKMGHMVC